MAMVMYAAHAVPESKPNRIDQSQFPFGLMLKRPSTSPQDALLSRSNLRGRD